MRETMANRGRIRNRRVRRRLAATLERCEERCLLATVGFSVPNDWGTGFQGQLSITNDQPAAVRSWTLSFDFSHDIQSIWGAQIVSHQGNHYVLQNAGYDGLINPGSTVSVGFTATPGHVTDTPTNEVFQNHGVQPAASVLSQASVEFTVVNNWNSGFQGDMTIQNPTSSDINGWTLAFNAPYNITQIWNADIISHQGNQYVVANQGSDAIIPSHSAVRFGFIASPGGTVPKPTGYVLNGVALGQPTAPPSASVANTTVTDGVGANVSAAFAVTLSEPASQPVTIAYATSDGTALAGTDYVATQGTLTFQPGETSKSINVAVLPTTSQSSRSFTLTFSSPTGATLAQSSATGTINPCAGSHRFGRNRPGHWKPVAHGLSAHPG